MDELEWRLVDLKSGRVYELTVTALGDGDIYVDSLPAETTFRTVKSTGQKLYELAESYIAGFLALEPIKVGYLQ